MSERNRATPNGYFDPMLESSAGVTLLVASVGMVALAWVFIRKIVDIKV